jgi:multisubunit Na+/H+ antiporter MnhE subunit
VRRIGWGGAAWAALFGLWLLLVDTFDPPELLAGAAAALIGVAAGAIACRNLGVRIEPRELLRLAPLPLAAVRDTVTVTAALVEHLSGRRRTGTFRQLPLGDAPADAATAAGSRVLQVLATSFAPNRYVVDVDAAAHSVTVHVLVSSARRRRRRRESASP